LANDDEFTGIAVVDVVPWDFMRADAYSAAKPYVARAHALSRTPGALANRTLAGLAQSQLAVLAVGGREIIASVVGQRKGPEGQQVVMDRDRTFHGDYSRASADELTKRRQRGLSTFDATPPTPETWLAEAARVEPFVKKIRDRGGDVVFVHLPITGTI